MQKNQIVAGDNAIRFYPYGETAIVLEYTGCEGHDPGSTSEHGTAPNTSSILDRQQRLLRLQRQLQFDATKGIIDCIPGNQNLTVHYDPLLVAANDIYALLKDHWQSLDAREENCHSGNSREEIVTVPVIYGGEQGPDLSAVARYHNLSEAEVIKQHSSVIYTVLFNGFLPGFPYLAGLPESLHTPRRNSPRMKVKAGSIAIGGSQTGIYPIDSPGGWQIIGRCLLQDQNLFDPGRSPPQLFPPACQLKFEAVEP